MLSYSGWREDNEELLFGASKAQRRLVIQEYSILMAITPALQEMELEFIGNFIVNGLTPAAFIGKKISFTLDDES